MWKNQNYKTWAFQPWGIWKEHSLCPSSKDDFQILKTLYEAHRPLQLYRYCPRGLQQKNGSFLKSRYWHRKYSIGSEGFDASAIQASQSEVHIQSPGHIQLLTHTPPTVSDLLMWDSWCSTEKIVSGAHSYPLEKADRVERYVVSAPNKSTCTFSLSHL